MFRTVLVDTHVAIVMQGLHPSNMFACGMDFLLRLKPAALGPLAEQYADPAPLKIGIHIRVRDQQLVRSCAGCRRLEHTTLHDQQRCVLVDIHSFMDLCIWRDFSHLLTASAGCPGGER